MALDPQHYESRPQAFVKHTFLQQYLPALANKLANSRNRLVYIDGFAGPWQSSDEQQYSDTSFGIALDAMRAAQDFQKSRGHKLSVSVHLVEKNVKAHAKLQALKAIFPTIEIIPYLGKFEDHFPQILNALKPSDFCFTLIDPKGLSLDVAQLAPLLSRPRSEVVINFMYDFFNRLAGMDDKAINEITNALMLGDEWRPILKAAQTPKEREKIVSQAFCQNVKGTGQFDYVTTLTVQTPQSDRTFYHLVFGTRHPVGLSVFRDSQIKALEAQAQLRTSIKSKAKTDKSGMGDLFGGQFVVASDPSSLEIEEGKAKGIAKTKELIQQNAEGIVWSKLWPQVLKDHIIRKSTLAQAINIWRKQGQILAPNWRSTKHRVPADNELLFWNNL